VVVLKMFSIGEASANHVLKGNTTGANPVLLLEQAGNSSHSASTNPGLFVRYNIGALSFAVGECLEIRRLGGAGAGSE